MTPMHWVGVGAGAAFAVVVFALLRTAARSAPRITVRENPLAHRTITNRETGQKSVEVHYEVDGTPDATVAKEAALATAPLHWGALERVAVFVGPSGTGAFTARVIFREPKHARAFE